MYKKWKTMTATPEKTALDIETLSICSKHQSYMDLLLLVLHLQIFICIVTSLFTYLHILTDKRKDTEYFTILFYKMQEHILFGNCKSYACCILVGLSTLNKVQ